MSTLSFVALELQTTHLDPASVSQASYVKLVNGNITLVDSWPVIPPTVQDVPDQTAGDGIKTWREALSQLNMMVGQLPIVSYYRDADKEVFQSASRHIGETVPEFHWLDCRELAKTYLPDLPEFQLSTVLTALDLSDEYGDSDSVEQTAQIVVELARRENAATVEELWGDLYTQPDKRLGMDAGLEGLNFGAAATTMNPDRTNDSEHDPETQDDTAADHEDGAEPPADTAFTEQAEEPDDTTDDSVERVEEQHTEAPHGTDETETLESGQAEATPEPQHQPLAQEVEISPEATQDSMTEQEAPEHETETSVDDEQRGPDTIGTEDSPPESAEPMAAPLEHSPTEYESITASEQHAQSMQYTPAEAHEHPAGAVTTGISTEPAPNVPGDIQTTAPTPEAVDVPERTVREHPGPKKSTALRVLGFLGVFGFGLLTVVGLVLTIMAAMLFFTENSLLLETKIAGVILTGAICLLSLLLTIISFRSFRNN